MTPREIWLRLTAWMRRDDLSAELAEEVQAHLDLLARDFEQEGMSRSDALAMARKQLGNVAGLRESSRDYWGFPKVEAVLQDLRYAIRGLVRSPGFTATVVVTLGLGIGANAAMFAVIDRLMFRPFPYMRDPSTVSTVYMQVTSGARRSAWATVPYTRFLDLRRDTRSFSQYAAVSAWRLAVGVGQATRVRKVAGVSASFFEFFDAAPESGRYFGVSEDVTPLGSLVAVLSHAFWQSEFGRRDAIGQQLQVGSLLYTIIGVAPEGFVGTVNGRVPEIFIPITTVPANIDRSNSNTYFTLYNWDWTEIMVRRKPGVSEAAANADLTSAYIRSRNAQRATNPRVLPDSVAKPRAILGGLRSAAGPDAGLESRVLLWVTGVAGIVLLIACANVANLMLTRNMRRRREIAVRLALGVSRRRLVAQFIMEGLLLSSLGAVAALLVAQWAGIAIRSLLLPEGSTFNMSSDWRTIGVAGACALAATLLTVIAPAFLATRSDLAATMKAGAREGTYRSSRARSAFLVMQGALSVALLVGAGLFVRSLNRVLAIPLGYDATTVLDMFLDFRGLTLDSAERVVVQRRLLATAQTIPGVEAAARVNSGLFRTNTAALRVPGIDSVQRLGRFNFQVTTPDYFRVMRTRILRGRGFTDADGAGAPRVVVVSEAMSRVLWPGKDPLGQCLQVGFDPRTRPESAPCSTVIGVAEDAAYQDITDEQRFVYYLAVDQVDPSWFSTILVRMREGEIEEGIERVRRTMQAAMPGIGFVVVRPLQEVVDDRRRGWRLGATLFVAFGGLALVVAAVGLYGVIGYNVAQRMHELGVRIALGARSSSILRLVLSQGLAFGAAGVAIGLALALAASRWIEPLLYKQSPRDPATYAVVGAVMVTVALAASAVPAFRAVRADPNRALRSE
ncbi:MAG: ADOP family duplicated permease [Gemmatimonadaceae bacterium]